MSSKIAEQPPSTLPLEQLRDLYERIPFVRGRGRAALLHRLQRVSVEVRQARIATTKAPAPALRAARIASEHASDTSRC
jgi:hypothetical protein